MSRDKKTFFMIAVAFVLHLGIFLFGNKKLRFVEVHLDSQDITTQFSMGNFAKAETPSEKPLTHQVPQKKQINKTQRPKKQNIQNKQTDTFKVEKTPKYSRKISSQSNDGQASQEDRQTNENHTQSSQGAKSASPQVSEKVIHGYIVKVRNRVNQKKNYPSIAKANNEEGRVILKLKLNKTGRLLAHEVFKKTEFNRLNQAAQESLLKAASSFPPFPKEMEHMSEITFTIPVNFSIRNKG